LNVVSDLTGRNLPPTLAADAMRIRDSVAAAARRHPRLTADAEHILAKLEGADALRRQS
jgi:hypothetical protein